jgi:16S rRNA (adenine1518-N6/adenine1519-N6)-dimethyltransferase
MFQKEVAERIVAEPGERRIMAGCRSPRSGGAPAHRDDGHRSAFVPPPKVASAVVHIVPAEQPEGVDPKVMERLTEAAFGQRRKMLRSSLKAVPGALDALAELGIDPQRAPKRSASTNSSRSRGR